MNMTEVRLFELACKGDRLDELNAEAVLNRRAQAKARRQALLAAVKRLLTTWRNVQTAPAAEQPDVVLSSHA